MKLHWFKSDARFYDNEKIKYIIKEPNGGMLFYLWQCLLGIAMCEETPGIILPKFGSIEKRLILKLGIDENIIKTGIDLFSSNELKMINILEDKSVQIANFSEDQALDRIEYLKELQKLNKAKQRAKTANRVDKLKQIEYEINNLKDKKYMDVDKSTDSLSHVPECPRPSKELYKKRKEDIENIKDKKNVLHYFNKWLIKNESINIHELEVGEKRNSLLMRFMKSEYYLKDVPSEVKE